MRVRVTIEYELPAGEQPRLRESEERRWMRSETVLTLPGSATVKIELLSAEPQSVA